MTVHITITEDVPDNNGIPILGLCDALVVFSEKETNKKYTLRGKFDGYALKNKKSVGYVNLPINSIYTKFAVDDTVAEIFTQKYQKITRKNVILIWDTLVKIKNFTIEEQEEE